MTTVRLAKLLAAVVAIIVVILLVAPAVFAAEVKPAEPSETDETQRILVLLDMPAPHFRPDGNYAGGYADPAARSARRRTVNALARSYGLRLVTDWPLPALGVDCFVLDVPAAQRPDEVAERLSREPRVAWAQPMNVFKPQGRATHDDALFSLQPAAREWQLAQLHTAATGRGVRVAVIDSGVQRDHPDLAGQVALSANFVADHPEAPELHGTAVAGIVAARADNRVGIVGVAPQAELLALRGCWQSNAADTRCTSLSLALALHKAIDSGAQVVNLSLGGPADRLLQRLIESAQARGALVVAAADRGQPRGGFPADLANVIAVVDDGSALSTAIVAPGTDVPTTLPGSRWATVTGSSYAAAHVSGLLALILELRPAATASGSNAADVIALRADRRVDACASIARAAQRCVCDCEQAAAAGSGNSADSIARH
jgi:subtilisin family serine protease